MSDLRQRLQERIDSQNVSTGSESLNKTVKLEVSVNKGKNEKLESNATLYSQDTDNNRFLISVKDEMGERIDLDSSYTVDILTEFSRSMTSVTSIGLIVGGDILYHFDTSLISKNEEVFIYLYLRKEGKSADVAKIMIDVKLSALDSTSGRVAESYDGRYEQLLADFEAEVGMTISEVQQVSVNEPIRIANEETRELAEGERESAEEQRKSDHANRSAEMDGKVDRVIEPDDFITFQDFVGGRNLVLNTSDTDFRELTILNPTHLISYNTGLKVEQGATYTVSMFVGDLSTNVAIEIGTGNQYGYLTNAQTSAIVLKLNQINTFVVTFEKIISEYGALYFRFRSGSADNTVVRFNKLKVTKGSTIYPYTKAPEDFSEITQRDVDEYIATTLPSVSDLATKANKKQEDWITVPLLNGVEHGQSPLKFMKDEMGIVHFKGSLTNLRTGYRAFILPIGYYPDIGVSESFIRIPVALRTGREMYAVQINYVGAGYIYLPSDTDIAYFDGVSYVAKGG